MAHEWKDARPCWLDGEIVVRLTDDGLLTYRPAEGWPNQEVDGRFLRQSVLEREILRLAEENSDLKDALDFSKAQVTDLAAWNGRLAQENRALNEFLENGKLRTRAVAEAHERALARIAALEEENRRLREAERERPFAELNRVAAGPGDIANAPLFEEQGFPTWVSTRCPALDPVTGQQCCREIDHGGPHRIHPVTPG